MKKTISTPSWDALLDTDVCDQYNNADLTITLKLGFKQINPPTGAATGTYPNYGITSAGTKQIVKWTLPEWEGWKNHFVKTAQKYWNGKFWLVNNFPELEYELKGIKYRPNVWCKFDLVGGDASRKKHHHIIEVVRLDKSEKWFGSHSKLYDSLDTDLVRKGRDSNGKAIMQRAHVHEIGHLLGIGHVDIGKKHCLAGSNTNARACYGVADHDKYSVMGLGMQRRLIQANPWRSAMKKLTTKGTIASIHDWKATIKRHYPRTLAEAAAKKHILTRPKR